MYRNRQDKYYTMSANEQLNFLKNNYEVIFIQLVNDESALMDMLFNDYYDNMPDFD
ncbi:hypothetical protein D3C81_2243190 [compost metagenome]